MTAFSLSRHPRSFCVCAKSTIAATPIHAPQLAHDYAYIVAAHNDIPAVLSEHDRLAEEVGRKDAEIARLREALKDILALEMGRGDGVVGDYIEDVQETARLALGEE